MEIMINYQGKPRRVVLEESKKYPIDVVYECEVEGSGTLEITYDYEGKYVELKNNKHIRSPLAELIGLEKDRVEKTASTEKSFPLSVEYKGKKFDLIITPVEHLTDNYKVVHAGHYLFTVSPPAGPHEHQWRAGYRDDVDQHFAAIVGIAIESR